MNFQMTKLEQELKDAYLQRSDIHGKILNIDQMQEYYIWMASNFTPSDTFRESILLDGTVGKLGQHLLDNPKDVAALSQLTALYATSPESNAFSTNQDISVCRPLRYMPPYWHTSEYFEVYYIFSGQCPVHFERETIVLLPGDVIIVPPYAKTATTFTSDDCVVLDVMLRASTFRQVFLEQLTPSNLMTLFFTKALSGSGENYLLLHTGTDKDLENILLSIYDAATRRDPYSARMRNPLMSTFFLQLLRQYEQSAEVSSHSGLGWKIEFAPMLIYIQTNYKTVTLNAVSEKFGYSQRQIIRIIKSCTGKTFTQLLTQLRMEKASALLKAGLSIEKTAAEVGYDSLSGFYQSFSNFYHATPGEFRDRTDA